MSPEGAEGVHVTAKLGRLMGERAWLTDHYQVVGSTLPSFMRHLAQIDEMLVAYLDRLQGKRTAGAVLAPRLGLKQCPGFTNVYKDTRNE